MGKGKRKKKNKSNQPVSKQKELPKSSTNSLTHLRDFLLLFLSALFVLLIYSNTFNGPFIFDDIRNIQKNPHIRINDLSKESITFGGMENLASNRPVAKLSFALNYYFHQYDVEGYHLFNIFLHIVTGLLLFLFMKATLNLPSLQSGSKAYPWIPFITALIWLVHPLHTQSVTYIVQRMNTMATLFYLLSLLLYIKGRLATGRKKKLTLFGGCIFAGILALGSKEIAATLPFFIFLYEWYFFQDLSWSWVKRHILKFVVVLLVLAMGVFLIMRSDLLEQMWMNYKVYNFTPVERVLTEFRVVIFYISLFLFPHPSRLNLDHDFSISHSLFDPITTIISLGIILGLIGLAFYIAKKDRLLSFCILWFFGNLVIESSMIGLEIIYEHRTYLPSLLAILLTVTLIYRHLKPQWLKVAILCVVVAMFSQWTYQRNKVWGDDLTLWTDATMKSPNKARPRVNLGVALADRGRTEEAVDHFSKALESMPDHAEAHNNLGAALADLGRTREAIKHYSQALKLKPDYADARNNIGVALANIGQVKEAADHFSELLRMSPDDGDLHFNLANALASQGKTEEAVKHYNEALRIRPEDQEVHFNLGRALSRRKKYHEAIKHYAEAIRFDPDYAQAHNNLGVALANVDKLKEAVTHYSQALRINPDYAEANNNMGVALARQGKFKEAISHFSKVLRIDPRDGEAHFNMANALASDGKLEKAAEHYAEALKIKPSDEEARQNRERVLKLLGKSQG
jgi:tetratricopeptide (TPR) repeat protein